MMTSTGSLNNLIRLRVEVERERRRRAQSGAVAAWRIAAREKVAALYEQKEHPAQDRFVSTTAKRTVVRAGRRGGKTVGVARLALHRFLACRRILYAAPTQDQLDRFWASVTRALADAVDAGHIYKNETRHILEVPGTENRIRAKTAWDADSLRGDYADDLILDEWQLMNEDAWGVVGAPMLLDTDGDAFFVYTPPSFRTAGVSKAHDRRHAAKLYAAAAADTTGRWTAFHFRSHDNPYISVEALASITHDMTNLAYRQEILAEDIDEVPGALWTRAMLDPYRVTKAPDLISVVTAIDPSATSGGDAAGIVTAGTGYCTCKGPREVHGFVLDDATVQGSPKTWASAAVSAYHKFKADKLVAESNNGGEMVAVTVETIPHAPYVKLIHASRGKHTRAQPIASLYEQGMIHHVGVFAELEDEQCSWVPGDDSPNRLDALVWAATELPIGYEAGI